MLPLLPFAAGLVTGAAAIQLWRQQGTRRTLDQAQDKLRQATVTSLSAIEKSSARMRERLNPTGNEEEEAPAVAAKPLKARRTPAKAATAKKPSTATRAPKSTESIES